MASTYSASLRLELMATGDQSGTWGVTTNTNLGTLLEQAITGVLSVAEGDTTLTLTTNNGSSDQARNAVVILTGAMTADRNVVVQTAQKLYLIKNSTTGGHNVIAKTAAGTGVTIAPNTSQWVYSDGTNVVAGLVGNGAPDANGNISANSFIPGYTTTATAAGTTTLTVTSTYTQYFTGSTTQTVVLPVASTMTQLGQGFEIVNNSTGSLTINSSGGNLVATVLAGNTVRVEVILLSGTTAASWNVIASSVPNPLSLSGSTVGYTPYTGISTEAAAAAGPIMELYRNSASPATNDVLGQLLFSGQSTANKRSYAYRQATIVTATDTAEVGTMDDYVMVAGTATRVFSVGPNNPNTPSQFVNGYSTTASAAGTTTLTVTSSKEQYFTGTSTQTVVLPVTSTLVLGQQYRIVNNSTGGAITVQSSGANNIVVIPQGSTAVLTCILTSGTTAASWDAKTAPNGGLVLLTSGTVSSAANLSILLTGYTAYRGIMLALNNFIPATNNVDLYMRVSSNGGSSYDSGASNYRYSAISLNSGTATAQLLSSSGATQIDLTPGGGVVGSGTSEGCSVQVTLMDQNNSAIQPKITWNALNVISGGNPVEGCYSIGLRTNAQITNAVQFLFSSGNITSGSYAVYGYM